MVSKNSQQIKKKPRFRKHKKILVFDEKKRKDFLTGFRKRKEKRRKVAQEQLEEQLKVERKRIKSEIKDTIKNQLKKSFEPIPELEEVVNENEYEDEDEDVTVKITELSTKDIAKQSNLIGDYYAQSDSEDDIANNKEIDEKSDEEAIPGMSVEKTSTQKDNKSKLAIDAESLKTKSEVNRFVMKNVEKYMKNSKAFKTKTRMDAVKNRKKARKENNKRKKVDKYKGNKKTKAPESSHSHHGHGKGVKRNKKKR